MTVSSLRAVFAIAENDLACYARNRMAIFWTFLGPAWCMWLFGFLTPSVSGLAPVTVNSSEPNSRSATALIAELRRHGHSVTEAKQPAARGLSIDLPPTGSTAPILLRAGEQEDEAERSLRYEVQAQQLLSAAHSDSRRRKPVFKVDSSHEMQGSSGFQRTVPAYLIMFLTMNLLMSGAGFSEERASGRVRRLLTAPIPALSIIAGRLASRLVIAWLQMVVLLSIGVFLLHIRWADHAADLVLIVSLYVLAMGSIGILIGTYFEDPDQATAFAMWSALILAPLTGLWWPIELMPAALQSLGHWLPTGWVMQSVNAMLAHGAGLSEFRLAAAGMVAIAGVALWMSSRRLGNAVAL